LIGIAHRYERAHIGGGTARRRCARAASTSAASATCEWTQCCKNGGRKNKKPHPNPPKSSQMKEHKISPARRGYQSRAAFVSVRCQ
jgi:hypothetical protein